MNFKKLRFSEWETVTFRVTGNDVTSKAGVPFVICEIQDGHHAGEAIRMFQPKPSSKSYTSWVDTFGADLDVMYGAIFEATAMPKLPGRDMQFWCKFELVSMGKPISGEDIKDNLAEIPF